MMNQQFKKSPKLEKWLRWMKDIENEISHLLGDVEAFRRVREIVNANPRIQKPHRFYRYLFDSYISHAIIGLRRQIKSNTDSISIARLLEEIANAPQELSFNYYCSLLTRPLSPPELAIIKHDFKQHADASGTHVCPRMVEDDLDELRKTTIACEEYADKRIAHRDKREPKLVKTYEDLEEELNRSLEVLRQTFEKYYLLFHAGSTTVKPTYQGDWKAIFSEPWMRDSPGSAN